MRRRKFIVAMISVLAMLLVFTIGLVACDPKGGEPQTVGDEAYYLSLKSMGWNTYQAAQDIPAGVLLEKDGDNYKLSIALDADDEFTVNKVGSDEKLGFDAVFSTLDRLVAGEQGRIKVVKTGVYTILLDGGAITYTYEAIVDGVTISAPTSTLEKGEEYQFAAVVDMSDGSVKDGIVWSSDNTQVASVSEDGMVSALEIGNATIKATSIEDESKFAEFEVEVVLKKVEVQSVTLKPTSKMLDVDETLQLTAEVLPADATNKSVVWSSNNDSVATVSGGLVTAVAPGVAIITVRTSDMGKEANCTITVRQPVTGIDVPSALKLVANGSVKTLAVEVKPLDATIKEYEASVVSGKEYISLELNAQGVYEVKGIAAGEATIEVVSKDDASIKAQVAVTVLAEGSVLVDMPSELRVKISEQKQLQIDIDNVQVQSVEWTAQEEAFNLTLTPDAEDMTKAAVTGEAFGTQKVTAKVTLVGGEVKTLTTSVLVADDWYFIYGVGLGEVDWDDWSVYVSDKEKAKADGRLLEETSRGVFTLTRKLVAGNGFQIIFPSVNAYTDASGHWNKDIKNPSAQYDRATSDDAYVSNSNDQFKVNTTGIYTITLRLTSTSIKVSIKLVEISIKSVSLKVSSGTSTVLKQGNTLKLSVVVTPDNATYVQKDIKVTFTSAYANYKDYADCYLNGSTVTISVFDDAPERFEIEVKVSVKDAETACTVEIVPKNFQMVPVTEIAFDEASYGINVNNGGGEWKTTVRAHVNSDATAQSVTYSADSNGISVNPTTGDVEAYRFGTFTITATAGGDANKTTSVQLTVYSDTFYLVGTVNGELNWDQPAPLPQGNTDISGSAFEGYALKDEGDHKHFVLERSIVKSNNSFQIVYLGMDSSWSHALTTAYFDAENSTGAAASTAAGDELNVKLSGVGEFRIEVDLSGDQAKFTVTQIRQFVRKFSFTSDPSEIHHQGDEFSFMVTTSPQITSIREGEFYYEYVDEAYEGYLDITYNASWHELFVKVVKAPESGIVSVPMKLICQCATVSLIVTIAADGEEEVKPTSVTFEKDHYYFNINDGIDADWVVKVKASVNEEATNKGVVYSVQTGWNSFYASVNGSSGEVTTDIIGTYTIVASALGDTSVQATTKVTFYSDTVYIVGEIGDMQTFATLGPNVTELSGIYAEYGFTMVDETHFVLEKWLRQKQFKPENYGQAEYGFYLAYLGALNPKLQNPDKAGSYGYDTYLNVREGNTRVNVSGVYRIELDLTEGYKWTVMPIDIPISEVKVTSPVTTIAKGDTVELGVELLPAFKVEDEYKQVKVTTDSEYISASYADGKIALKVNDAPCDGDITVKVTATYGSLSKDISLTLTSQHHLVQGSDENGHFMECSDPDCDYRGESTSHTMSQQLQHDALAHYKVCEECGYRQEVTSHFEGMDGDDYWYDFSFKGCETCGLNLYDFDPETGILKNYYGAFKNVHIPAQIDGHDVRIIGESAFRYNAYLVNLKVDAVQKIGSFAFANCTALETYEFPLLSETPLPADDGYDWILGSAIFGWCTALRTAKVLTAYDSVNYGTVCAGGRFGMFEYCTALESATFDRPQFGKLADALFMGCSSLCSIAPLPDDLDSIAGSAFAGTGFTHFDFPKNLRMIGISAFDNSALSGELVLPESVTMLYKNAFSRTKITKVCLPANTRTAGNSVFYECTELEFVSFGENFAYFSYKQDYNTFTGCSKLKTVLFKSKDFHYVPSGLFGGCYRLEYVFVYKVIAGLWGSLKDNELFDHDSNGNSLMYGYSDVQPEAGQDYGAHCAGWWHYDEEGNPVVWDEKPAEAAQILDIVPVTLYAEDKKR